MPVEVVTAADNDEAELIARARRKDASAVALIIRQHNQRLYRIARSILRDDFEPEDALQEIYIRAFSRLDLFRGDSRLGTWLARYSLRSPLWSPSLPTGNDSPHEWPRKASILATRSCIASVSSGEKAHDQHSGRSIRWV
jgi:hypothetical protein